MKTFIAPVALLAVLASTLPAADTSYRDAALEAARWIRAAAAQTDRGTVWPADPRDSKSVNDTLYAKQEFLDAALAGAKYLRAVAKTDNDVCLIFHNEPDGRDLYYLGWCHGPVGTARLFYRLYQVTGDRVWMDWVQKSARGIIESGIPEKQTPGFWNNVSQCCGSGGVAEFFLSLYRVTKDRAYLEFSNRVTAQLLAKATRDRDGMRWIQAEHRVRPELLVAQTGYMQGAAGIGMLFLHLDAFQRGKQASIIFPDSPFD